MKTETDSNLTKAQKTEIQRNVEYWAKKEKQRAEKKKIASQVTAKLKKEKLYSAIDRKIHIIENELTELKTLLRDIKENDKNT